VKHNFRAEAKRGIGNSNIRKRKQVKLRVSMAAHLVYPSYAMANQNALAAGRVLSCPEG
jgi:hypothetical protein